MRVVIADDNLLVRKGIAALLRGRGVEVAAEAGDADELLRAVSEHGPDVAIVDIRMPPTHTDEGLRAAQDPRARDPAIAIVVLSQHVELGVATRVLAEHPARLGYLLKDRVTDVDEFVGTLRRVAAGGTALDPLVVSRLLGQRARRRAAARADAARARGAAAGRRGPVEPGRSPSGMGITLRSAEKHVSSIFAKLGLPDTGGEHRRVLAVLRFLAG